MTFDMFSGREVLDRFATGEEITWINEAAAGIGRDVSLQRFDLLDEAGAVAAASRRACPN